MTATSKKKARKQSGKKSVRKTTVKKKTARSTATARKSSAKKASAAKKVTKKTTTVKKKAAKAVKKASTTKKAAKKAPAKKAPAKKTAVKKTSAKKSAKKSTAKKTKRRTSQAARTRKPASDDDTIHGIVPYKSRRGEEYMNSDQLEHFREILSSWRRELISEINRTIHSMQDETVNHPDPNDRATQETDMSLELRSRDRERKLIKKIDDTISLIDAGDYGYCEKCGVEVGIARLEARPTASLCIDCKTLDEIREKQMI